MFFFFMYIFTYVHFLYFFLIMKKFKEIFI
ncbi:hypothetical protein PFUGPA_03470 [Plasmodium falciparum Palo Alto/Uganda]|uniref:Uncharacterized protein n=1 Tax=Plasmodium falciparum (isolate Palo Alto / Uganda) TaxID=57270 RepID=W4IXW4_PLAFP|nr:hypothetical protein PFUGPA_03470 [Plasmodium falciparum Palo Alto/Uganda]